MRRTVSCPTHPRSRADRGYVTVLVLMVAGLLAVLVAATLQVARPSVGQAVANVEELKADGLIEAGIVAVGYTLYAARKPPKAIDGAILPFESGAIRLSVGTEAGRVDLNGADPALLEGLYKAVGSGAMPAAVFAARVVDWRDTNRRPRPGGAEAEEYRGKGLDYTARNGPFQSIDELALVLGVEEEDYARLAPYLTVYNPGGLVDPTSADGRVLLAVPGMSPGAAEAIVKTLSDPEVERAEVRNLLRPYRKYLTAGPGSVFRVVVEARLTGGYAKSVEAVLMSGGDRDAAYRVLSWRVLGPDEDAATGPQGGWSRRAGSAIVAPGLARPG